MLSKLLAAVLGALTFLPVATSASTLPFRAPDAGSILKTLKAEYPRLLLNATRVEELRGLVQQDELAKKIYRSIESEANKALKQKPAFYELRDGRRLIYVSQEVSERILNLAFVHLITQDRKYADRAWLELESASKFKDWNPDHFLDTAIMTGAFAIGLDWFWNDWTPPQRDLLRRAIVELGLKPAMKVYDSGRGWPRVTNNWNQVCNGGIGMGALAVADTEPELADKILHHAMTSLPKSMEAYAPDGASHEGLGYWNFGSQYNIMLMASLESALGTDFGLSQIDGFKQSGDYQIHLSGTKRHYFDFGDCGRSPASAPQHFWMGHKYGIPRYSWYRHDALSERRGGSVMDLLWFDTSVKEPPTESMPLDKHFRKVEVASMRDSWSDSDGFIVAMQGGDNAGSHRHLDLGSFILEMDGVRWIVDSGKDRETYQRHTNKAARTDFYRVRAEGHNTLVLNPDQDPDQNIRGKAAFTDFVSTESQASASLDLSNAYSKNADKVTRTFELERQSHLIITDRITCKEPAEVWSFFHTEAEVKLSGDKRTAFMRQNGKILRLRLGLPTDAVFELLPASPFPKSPNPPSQASNEHRRKLAVHLSGVKDTVISVRFER